MLLAVFKARKNLDGSCGYCSILSLSIIRRTKIFLLSLVWNSWFLTEDLAFFLSLICVLAAKTNLEEYKRLFYWLCSLSLLPSNLCWFEYFCNIEVSCHYFLQGPYLNTFVECVQYDNVQRHGYINFILTWLSLFLLLLERSKKHDEHSISGIGKNCIKASAQSVRKCFYLKASCTRQRTNNHNLCHISSVLDCICFQVLYKYSFYSEQLHFHQMPRLLAPLQPLNAEGIFWAKDWVSVGQAFQDASLLRSQPRYCRALRSDNKVK